MEKDLKKRTKNFALKVIGIMNEISNRNAGYDLKRQLFRSGTSVGANYRAACIARSKADFISKIAIAQEEADESCYWLELLEESGLGKEEVVAPIRKEASELTAILTASILTAKKNKD